MARIVSRIPPSPARSLFLAGAALLSLYLFALKDLSGVTNAFLLAFAGLVVGVLLDIPTEPLARRMPRPVAVVIVLAVSGAALFVAARLTLPALGRQFAVLATQIPVGVERLWSAARSSPPLGRALPERIDLSPIGALAFGHLLPFVGGTLAALGGLVLVVAIGAFACADPEGDLRSLDAVVPARHRERLHDVLHRSTALLRRWLGGMLVTMAIVGALTTVGLLVAGVHGWLALGLLAFAGALVPYLGSFVVGAAIFAAGLADSPRRALIALGVYAVIQALQGSVISPVVNRFAVRTSPTLLLVFQFIMGASFGVLGVFLAQPLLAVATVLLAAMNDARAESTGDFDS